MEMLMTVQTFWIGWDPSMVVAKVEGLEIGLFGIFPISIPGEFRLCEIDAYEMMVRPALWRREMCTLVKSAQKLERQKHLGRQGS